MEFIGIAGNFSDYEIEIADQLSKEYGYIVIKNHIDYDFEIMNGVGRFMKQMRCDSLLQFILEKKGEEKTSYSNLLVQEIFEQAINDDESSFFSLLKKLKTLIKNNKKFYLIFASEWEIENFLIRYYSNSSIEIADSFFRINNNWFIAFYNYNNQSYQYEMEIPLVFEITR